MKVIKSQKGFDKICHEGYVYRRNTTNNETQSWRCAVKDCKGTASTSIYYFDGSEVVVRQKHNHEPGVADRHANNILNMLAEENVIGDNT